MTAESATLPLRAEPTSPRRARDFVESTLLAWGLHASLDEVKLLTSELVTNAVLHARTQLILTVATNEDRSRVQVSVRDGSKKRPRRHQYSDLATTGRGLHMIDQASLASGVDDTEAGKAVWFEIAVSDAALDALTDSG